MQADGLITHIMLSIPPIDGRVFIAICALGMMSFVSVFLWLFDKKLQTPFERAVDFLMWAILHRLNRSDRGAAALRVRGLIVTGLWAILVVLFFVPMQFIALKFQFNSMFQFIVLSCLLSPSSFCLYLFSLRKAMADKGGKATGVFWPLTQAGGVNLVRTDDAGLTRFAVSEAMHSLAFRVALPLVSYVMIGLFGALFVTGIAILIRLSRGGVHGRMFTGFVRVLCAPFYCVANMILIPTMIMAGVMTPNVKVRRLSRVLGHSKTIMSDQFPAAMAACLMGIVLGGPVQNQKGERVNEDWLGTKDASARVELHELTRAGYFYALALFMLLLVLCVCLLVVSEDSSLQFSAWTLPQLPELPAPVLSPATDLAP